MSSSILFERYELKYWVPESLTREIARFISPFVELDPASAQAADQRYTITSVYLDSPRWSLYRECVEDRMDRFKLRIRTYGERSDGPVAAEVKRKVKDVIVKSRAFLPRDLYPACIAEPLDARPAFRTREEARYYEDFVRRASERRVSPRVLVRYTREAYESVVDDYARVTFDRDIRYQLADGYDLLGDPRAWVSIDGARETGSGAFACLELKCEAAFPSWIQDLVRTFDLSRGSYSKYVRAVACEREERTSASELDLVSRFGEA